MSDRPALEILLEVERVTREVLWNSPRVDDAERLLARRQPMIAESLRKVAGTWSAEEEAVVRRIASLDRELLTAVRAPLADAFAWLQRRDAQRGTLIAEATKTSPLTGGQS